MWAKVSYLVQFSDVFAPRCDNVLDVKITTNKQSENYKQRSRTILPNSFVQDKLCGAVNWPALDGYNVKKRLKRSVFLVFRPAALALGAQTRFLRIRAGLRVQMRRVGSYIAWDAYSLYGKSGEGNGGRDVDQWNPASQFSSAASMS